MPLATVATTPAAAVELVRIATPFVAAAAVRFAAVPNGRPSGELVAIFTLDTFILPCPCALKSPFVVISLAPLVVTTLLGSCAMGMMPEMFAADRLVNAEPSPETLPKVAVLPLIVPEPKLMFKIPGAVAVMLPATRLVSVTAAA